MKIFLPVVFLLFLLQNQSYSQDFEPGYIVTLEKDKIQGFILEEVDSDLVYEIKFQRSRNSEIQEFSPKEISGFGFDYGRTFRSLKFTDVKSGEDRVVFVKEVETGKIDVLIWRTGKNRKPDIFLVNQLSKDTVHLTRPRKELAVSEHGKQYSKEDRDYLRLLGDIKGEGSRQEEIRYNENKIRRDIRSYNEEFYEGYEVTSYQEKKGREYTILGGTAMNYNSDRPRLRLAVIQSRTAVERTNTLSYISGIFYSYREVKDVEMPTYYFYKGNINFKRQVLSFIPIGLMLQTKPAKIRPYVYAGAGIAVVKLDDYLIEFEAIEGTDTNYNFGATLTAGAGAKIRLGSNYLVTEIAPASSGIYFNVGYSF